MVVTFVNVIIVKGRLWSVGTSFIALLMRRPRCLRACPLAQGEVGTRLPTLSLTLFPHTPSRPNLSTCCPTSPLVAQPRLEINSASLCFSHLHFSNRIIGTSASRGCHEIAIKRLPSLVEGSLFGLLLETSFLAGKSLDNFFVIVYNKNIKDILPVEITVGCICKTNFSACSQMSLSILFL